MREADEPHHTECEEGAPIIDDGGWVEHVIVGQAFRVRPGLDNVTEPESYQVLTQAHLLCI